MQPARMAASAIQWLPLIKTLSTIHLYRQIRTHLRTHQTTDTGLRLDHLGRVVTHTIKLWRRSQNPFLTKLDTQTATFAKITAHFDCKDFIFLTHIKYSTLTFETFQKTMLPDKDSQPAINPAIEESNQIPNEPEKFKLYLQISP
jgi:hypothetical protein